MKKKLILMLQVLAISLGLPCTAQTQKKPPNIVWILGEDICPDLGCYGEKAVRTPHLDQLAAQGLRYSRAFTTSPVCSTSRSAMMTGMYQNAIGAHQHRTKSKKPLPSPVMPFPLLLRKAGYHTGLMQGKKLDLNFTHKAAELFPDGDWSKAGERPFFVQITFANTHRTWHHYPDQPVDPAEVTVPPYYPDTPLVRRDIANGLEEMQVLDAGVGMILARLESEGLTDNTLVIFIGDHGRCQVRGKQFLYDSGTHVPLILRWPGHIEPGAVDGQLVSSIDVTATVLAAAGIEVPNWMHGRDLLDPDRKKRQHVFLARDKMDSTHDAMRAVRTERFKYIHNLMPERAYCQLNEYKERQYPVLALLNVMHMKGELNEVQARFMQPKKRAEELYDLIKDPFETRNLAMEPDHAEVLERMRSLVEDWRKQIDDPGVTDEFREGGWSSDYPTRTLQEWQARLDKWEATMLIPGGGPKARKGGKKRKKK